MRNTKAILINTAHKEELRTFFSTEKQFKKYGLKWKEGNRISSPTIQNALNYFTHSELAKAIRKKAKAILLRESKKPVIIK